MNRRQAIYWIAQLAGWGVFIIANLIIAALSQSIVPETWFSSAIILIAGVTITHLMRLIFLKLGWNKLGIFQLIPRILFITVLEGVILFLIQGALQDLVFSGKARNLNFDDWSFMAVVLNLSAVFLIWNLIYFTVHVFENFRAAEIRNLELRAAKTEIELNSFKNQLNPHFIFNALNSIRALVDEEPKKAKRAITILSGILRFFLTLDPKPLIPLSEELELVEKYLEIEKIRFEERLLVTYDVEVGTRELLIPPFMLQTIVENGIKHGIGLLKSGGELHITAARVESSLLLTIRNSGKLGKVTTEKGVGLSNTRHRLELLFGQEASFDLREAGKFVVATLTLPQQH